MKPKLKHCITALLLVAAVNFTPTTMYAQTDVSIGDTPCDPDNPCDTNVPLDGGISLLVAAGVAYGIKKKYDYSKQIAEE